ncbi:hypothetical protein CLOM_g1169, partial [Closterium sp. NIES-68]
LPLGVNSTGHSSPPCSTRVPIHLPSSPHPPPILPWGTHRTLWLLPYCHLDPPGLPHFQFVRRSGHCAKGNFAGQGEGKRDNILGSLLFPPLLFPPLLSSPLLSSSSPLLSSPLLSSPLLSYPLLVVFISSPPLSSPLLSSPLLSSPLLSSPLLSTPLPSYLESIQDPLGRASRAQAPKTEPKPTHSFQLVVQ